MIFTKLRLIDAICLGFKSVLERLGKKDVETTWRELEESAARFLKEDCAVAIAGHHMVLSSKVNDQVLGHTFQPEDFFEDALEKSFGNIQSIAFPDLCLMPYLDDHVSLHLRIESARKLYRFQILAFHWSLPLVWPCSTSRDGVVNGWFHEALYAYENDR